MAYGLSCSAACGIFLDQGSNRVPCAGRQILNHCATREAPSLGFLVECSLCVQTGTRVLRESPSLARPCLLQEIDPSSPTPVVLLCHLLSQLCGSVQGLPHDFHISTTLIFASRISVLMIITLEYLCDAIAIF